MRSKTPESMYAPDFWDIEYDVNGEPHFVNHKSVESSWQQFNAVAERIAANKYPAQKKEVHTNKVVSRVLAATIAGGLLLAGMKPIHKSYSEYRGRRRDESADSYEGYESDDSLDIAPDIVPESTESAPAPTPSAPETTTESPQPISILESPSPRYGIEKEEIERIMALPAPIIDQIEFNGGEPLRRQDINHDPTFRASTLQLMPPGSVGTGALIEYDGELYVRTINHVLDTKDYTGTDMRHHIFIPGIGVAELPEYVLAFHENINDFNRGQDTNVLIPIRTELAQIIRDAESRGVITPLKISEFAPTFEEGRDDHFFVPNPETGHYYQATLVDPGEHDNEDDNMHWLVIDGFDWDSLEQAEAEGALICAGFSGTPLIDGNDSSIIHGQNAKIRWHYEEYRDGHDRICSIKIGVQAN